MFIPAYVCMLWLNMIREKEFLVVMLDAMLGLRLNCVVQLIVLMLNVLD